MLFEIDVAKEGVSVAKNFFEAKVNISFWFMNVLYFIE